MTTIVSALAVCRKELQILVRDRGWLAVLFLLPLVLGCIVGYANVAMSPDESGGDTISLPVAVVSQDEGVYGDQIVTVLKSIAALDITERLEPQANRLVADGKRIAAIVIPSGFSEMVDAHMPSTVTVIADPTREEYSNMVVGILNQVLGPIIVRSEIQYGISAVLDASGYASDADSVLRQATEAQTLGAIMTQLQMMQESPWIDVVVVEPEGIEAKGPWNPFSYTMPGFSVMFAFFVVGMASKALWDEKEQGSFRRLLAAPMSRSAIIGGKILAYSLVVVAQVLLLFAVGSLVFQMPLGDSLVALILLTVATALTSSGLGILVAAISRSSKQADSLGVLLGFVLAALGGCIVFPLYRLDGFLGLLPRLVPHGHAMIAFEKLLNGGGGVIDILPQLGVLVAMAAVFFGVGTWRLKWD